jgi:hypothetical protein
MNDKAKGEIPPLIISITSSTIVWDPDDEVGQEHEDYFEATLKYLNSGIVHILPGAKISDLEFLKNFKWEDDRYCEAGLSFILESAEDNFDNPSLDSPSAVFKYRIVFHFDISEAVEEHDASVIAFPEVFVNEFVANFYIGMYEWPRGDTNVHDWDLDEENGYRMIPMETISFMGDIYDIRRG